VTIKAVKVGTSWKVVDTAVPGWRDLESHSSEGRAREAVKRLTAQQACGVRLVHSASTQSVPAASSRREMLATQLKGKAGEVRRRIEQVTSVDDLAVLAELEDEGLGRATVLRTIEARRSAVA